MEGILYRCDSLRAYILQRVLSISFFRDIFKNRSSRLAAFFAMSFVLNLFLSLFFPLVLLLFGPLFFGVPHIVSSIRTLSSQEKKQCPWVSKGLIILLALVAIERSFFSSIRDPFNLLNGFEILAFVGAWFLLAFRRRNNPREHLLAIVVGGSVFALSYFWPLTALGVIAISHNLVPFFYWHAAAKTTSEKNLVKAAFAATLFGILFILSPAATIIPASGATSLDPFGVLNEILPGFFQLRWMTQILCAFAFSQAMHYFIWLKAIPEQGTATQIPLSFRQSFRSLTAQFGKPITYVSIFGSIALTLAALFIDPVLLRKGYLVFASSHGYMELAGLPFLGSAFKGS